MNDEATHPVSKFSAKMQILFVVGNCGFYNSLSKHLAPWSNATCEWLTSLIASFVVAYVYYTLAPSKLKDKKVITRAFRYVVLAAIAYGLCVAVFVRGTPEWEDRVVVGWQLESNVQSLHDDNPTTTTVSDLVKGNDGKTDGVWEPWTLGFARFLCLTTWAAACGTLAYLVAVLVRKEEYELSQKTKSEAKPKRVKP